MSDVVDNSRFWNQKLVTGSSFVDISETEVGSSPRLEPTERQRSLAVLGLWESGIRTLVAVLGSVDLGIRFGSSFSMRSAKPPGCF